MPQPSTVDVYWSRPRPLPEAQAYLDPTERERLATLYRPHDKNRYLSTHLLMRLALREATGIDLDRQRFDRTCTVCGAPHGKPTLVPPRDEPAPTAPIPHFNISHAAQRSVVAMATSAPIGVDVEHRSATDFAGFSLVALTPEEARELLDFHVADRAWAKAVWWSRKEAALKATGHGLRVEASSLRVSPPDRPPVLLHWEDPEVAAPRLQMADVPVGEEYASAVAVLGDAPLQVRVHDANETLARFAENG